MTLQSFAWLCAQTEPVQLPILRIEYDTLSHETFFPGQLTIATPDTMHYQIQIRRRGGTSLYCEKPTLGIKLIDSQGNKLDTTILGMRKDNYWVLDAMARDKARMRNRAAMDLWLEMSRKPWYQDLEPDCVNGYHGQMVDVYINDRHMGIYHLSERIDRKQLKLKKYNAKKGGIRGLLYKSDTWEAVYPFTYYIRPFPTDTMISWSGLEVSYPELDEGDSITWQPLLQFMEFFRTNSYNNLFPTINDYIDMPVYIDYVLFVNMLSARDNTGKNFFWSYYDHTLSNKALITLWDLDHSWGRQYNGKEETTNYEFSERMVSKFMRNNAFCDSLNSRYAYLRQHIFTVQHLDSIVGNYFNLFETTGMDRVEQEIWDGVDVALDIPSERAYIHNWLVKRIAFLDSVYHYTPLTYPVEGITTTAEYFTPEEKARCQRMNREDSTITLIFSPDRFDLTRDSLIRRVYAYGTITAWMAPVEDYRMSYYSSDSCFYTTLSFSKLERPSDDGQPNVYFRVFYSDTTTIDPFPIDSLVDSRLNLTDGGLMLMRPGDDINELGQRIEHRWEYAGLADWQLEGDEEAQMRFANFRRVPGTQHLYRSFHPYYPITRDETAAARVQYVTRCAERVGISSAICLSGYQPNANGVVLPCGDSTFVVQIPDYYQTIIDDEHILIVGQSLDYFPNYQNTLWFLDHGHYGDWMEEIIRFVCDPSHDVPFQIHCSLGADRTGSFSAVIAALCGASWEEIAQDYEATSLMRYQLYRHRGLIRYTLTQMLGEAPDNIGDLQGAMTDYIVSSSTLTHEEINAFVARLNETNTPTTQEALSDKTKITTSKVIRNGQMFIERNGQRYSILGINSK